MFQNLLCDFVSTFNLFLKYSNSQTGRRGDAASHDMHPRDKASHPALSPLQEERLGRDQRSEDDDDDSDDSLPRTG